MQGGISSTQLLHGYQYHEFRARYENRKTEDSLAQSTANRSQAVTNGAAISATTGADDLWALRALKAAHGHHRFQALDEVMCSASADSSAMHSPARSASRARSKKPNVSETVMNAVLQLRKLDPGNGRHPSVRRPESAEPLGSGDQAHISVSSIASADQVDWSTALGTTLNPVIDADHPYISVVATSSASGGGFDAQWMHFALRALSLPWGGGEGSPTAAGAAPDPDESNWGRVAGGGGGGGDHSAFGAGNEPQPTVNTANPDHEVAQSPTRQQSRTREERIRDHIETQRREARRALWRKITYGASDRSLADAESALRSHNQSRSSSPTTRARHATESRRLSPIHARPGRLTSFQVAASASNADMVPGQDASAPQNDVSNDSLPRLIGDSSMGVFEPLHTAPDPTAEPKRQGGLSRLERAVSHGDMPSKHDVIAALAAAKEHFSRVPLRSVLPLVSIDPSSIDAAVAPVESEKQHAERLADTAVNAALLSRVAMSASPADYRLASAFRTALKFYRGPAPQMRAWGITESANHSPNPAGSSDDRARTTSAFPAKWIIVSPDTSPLSVTVAIAWDPFPSLFEDAAPDVGVFEYVVAPPGDRLLQAAWTTLRLIFANAAEDVARHAWNLQEAFERAEIMRACSPLLCEIVEVPRTYWRAFYDANIVALRWMRNSRAPPSMRRRYQRAVVKTLESASQDRDVIAYCYRWLGWLLRRKKCRRVGTSTPAAADLLVTPAAGSDAQEPAASAADAAVSPAARLAAERVMSQTDKAYRGSAFSKWRLWTSRRRRDASVATVERIERAKPAVRMHRETMTCAATLSDALLTAFGELGITIDSNVTIVGHGSGGTLACAVAASMNRDAGTYVDAPSVQTVVTIGSPRLSLESPAAMCDALGLGVVCFGSPADPAIHCPLSYQPLSPGLFHFESPSGQLECAASSQLRLVPFAAHEHWKNNSIDFYISKFLDCGRKQTEADGVLPKVKPWPGDVPQTDAAEIALERAALSAAPESLRRGSVVVQHGFSAPCIAALQLLHTAHASKSSGRMSRNAVLGIVLLMSPQQPLHAVEARVPQGRRGFLDFTTFVEWLWSEHYSCPGFFSAFLSAAGWKWDIVQGAFARRAAPKLPQIGAMDPSVPLAVREAGQGASWTFTAAARSALEHIFAHISRSVPSSPFDAHTNGSPVATYNTVVLLLQQSRWSHPCSATRVVDALLTILEQRHVAKPRARLMDYGGSLTVDGFVAFAALLVDWFGEAFVLERLWVLGYNGLFQHSITRGALQNVHAKGSRYDADAEDRWLTRLRQEEEAEFNEWVTAHIDEMQREKLRQAQASSFRRVQSLRSHPSQAHVLAGSLKTPPLAATSNTSPPITAPLGPTIGADPPRPLKQRRKGGGSAGPASPPPSTGAVGARTVYSATPALHSWTATGDTSLSRPRKVDAGDDADVFTGLVETSVAVRLNGPLQQLARANRRKVLPKLSHKPRVNEPSRVDNLYTNCGVVHLVNPTQRSLLGLDLQSISDGGHRALNNTY